MKYIVNNIMSDDELENKIDEKIRARNVKNMKRELLRDAVLYEEFDKRYSYIVKGIESECALYNFYVDVIYVLFTIFNFIIFLHDYNLLSCLCISAILFIVRRIIKNVNRNIHNKILKKYKPIYTEVNPYQRRDRI